MKLLVRQLGALVRLSLLDLYRRKDLIAVGVLCLALLVPLAVLRPFGVAGADRYVGEIALLLIWLFSILLALGLAARQFPPEFESRTVFPLLARPVGRGTVLLGKFLGAFVASASALAVFYLLFAVYSGYRDGVWFPAVFLQAFLLHVAALAIVCALALFGSLLVTPSANLTFSGLAVFGMLLFGGQLPVLAASSPLPARIVLKVIYVIAPHFEFFDLRQRVVHAWAPVSAGVCSVVLLYAAFYVAAVLAAAAVILRRRQI